MEEMKKTKRVTVTDALIESLGTPLYDPRQVKMLCEISRLESIGDVSNLKKAVQDFKGIFASSIDWRQETIIVANEYDALLKEIDFSVSLLKDYEFTVEFEDKSDGIDGYVTRVVELSEVKRIINDKLNER